jgi:hypothetical protein
VVCVAVAKCRGAKSLMRRDRALSRRDRGSSRDGSSAQAAGVADPDKLLSAASLPKVDAKT